jgi:adenine-specific DNA-methyltransferase
MNFKEHETRQKLRGGYYTPDDLAAFLLRWARTIAPSRLLEPSCGDGAFFRAAVVAGLDAHASFDGFEPDEDEAAKAARCAQDQGVVAHVRPGDFLAGALDALSEGSPVYDAAVGNPPFIRYQYLPAPFQRRAERLFQRLGLTFTRHTNAWVPFVLASMALLRPGGRLAMVVPAEILHVMHAQPLRTYLGRECRRVVLVDPEELWFAKSLQGAVLLLAEKRRSPADAAEGVGVVRVKGREFLGRDPESVFNEPVPVNGAGVAVKWTRALLDSATLNVLDETVRHPQVRRFADVASVDVGIVTGANKYFLVTDDLVVRRRLGPWTHPMFGRSEHCPGVIYDEAQHRVNAARGVPTNFLWFDGHALDDPARAYVRLGERQRLHTRYKCRVRSPWYAVPSVHATEIGMLKRSHDTPRLVLNTLGAYTTDTAYRIRATGVSAPALVACFINPLTALCADLEGRHYGGGVLELVPSEIERLQVPLPPDSTFDLAQLDRDVRTLRASDVVEKNGRRVLGPLGLPPADQRRLLHGWFTLRDRRQRKGA